MSVGWAPFIKTTQKSLTVMKKINELRILLFISRNHYKSKHRLEGDTYSAYNQQEICIQNI